MTYLKHYIPAYAETRGLGRDKDQRTICGVWADPHRQHAPDPTCPDCQRLLADDNAAAAAIEAEFLAARETARATDARRM